MQWVYFFFFFFLNWHEVQVKAALDRAQLDASLPTLVLSECVLVYMKAAESQALIQLLADTFKTAAIAVRHLLSAFDVHCSDYLHQTVSAYVSWTLWPCMHGPQHSLRLCLRLVHAASPTAVQHVVAPVAVHAANKWAARRSQ